MNEGHPADGNEGLFSSLFKKITGKVKKDDDEKYVTLPKKKGTYYIKVSKLTDKTTGVYELETYKE